MVEFNKKTLDNGMIVLHEKRDVPVTTVMLGTRYGSAYEKEEEKGIAHFIEHLCFKGTEKRTAKEIACEVEKTGGLLNAFTAEEMTAYYVKLPSRHLNMAMDVLFDIFFNPVFPEEDVAREANVICEEIRMYNDEPRMHVLKRIKENLYKKPFGIFAAGLQENVKKFKREDLLKRHREVYVPENSVLCVVGNNDFDDVVKIAEEFSRDVKRDLVKHNVAEVSLNNLNNEEKRDNLQQANICLGFHFPRLGEKERYAAEVFSAILGQGMSSVLFTEVREKRGLAYAVRTFLELGREYGYMLIYIGTDKSKTKEVEEICLQKFHDMKDLNEEDIIEGKKQVIGNHDVDKEESNNTALNLIYEEICNPCVGAESYYKYKENIENVSLDDIKKIADKTEYASFKLLPQD